MIAIAIFGVLAGLALGLSRYRVFALLPMILLVAAAAIAQGIVRGLDPGQIAVGTSALASPQIGYLIIPVIDCFVVARFVAARR
jgi:hypothetical protein